MFRAEQIEELVALLEARDVVLYHACQFTDLLSYLQLGGVPSRSTLQASHSAFTPFDTDTSDQQKRVWDKVFVNLSDFGRTFAWSNAAVPNPYGPILLRIRPAALREATDVAICLRSAGAWDFDREKEALKSLDKVDRLFKHRIDGGSPWKADIKFKKDLQLEFPGAQEPEISCTVRSGRLSMEHVWPVVVDPYGVDGKPLSTYVARALGRGLYSVQERKCRTPEQKAPYGELGDLLSNRIYALAEISGSSISGFSKVSRGLRDWAAAVRGRNLDYQFGRYARYLRTGTLLPLSRGV